MPLELPDAHRPCEVLREHPAQAIRCTPVLRKMTRIEHQRLVGNGLAMLQCTMITAASQPNSTTKIALTASRLNQIFILFDTILKMPRPPVARRT